MTRRARVLYFLLLSSIAAVLLLVVFSVGAEQDRSISYSDKFLPVVAFVASCLLCISLTVSPNWVRRRFSRTSRSRGEADPNANAVGFRGHHPDCVSFQSHRISFGNREFCSGCLGLMLGAALSIPLMVTYAASDRHIPMSISVAFMAAGFGSIAIAYVEAAFGRRRPVLHLFANSFMIVGYFLLVVGMMEATGNEISGLLVVSFSFLWIDTRIQLSHWRHSIMCDECSGACKMY